MLMIIFINLNLQKKMKLKTAQKRTRDFRRKSKKNSMNVWNFLGKNVYYPTKILIMNSSWELSL